MADHIRDSGAAEVHALIAERVEALRMKDAERVAAGLAPSIIAFEMVPPLSLPAGAAAELASIRNWLEGWQGAIEVEVRDLTVHAVDDVAFSHSLMRLAGTTIDGRRVRIWMRSTFGLRKFRGRWMIVHSHTSVPFRLDGSRQAALDLEP